MGTLMQRPWQILLPPPEVQTVTVSVLKSLVRQAFELGMEHPRAHEAVGREIRVVQESDLPGDVKETMIMQILEADFLRSHPEDGEPCLGHCDQCGAVCLSQAAPTLNAAQNRARR